MSDETTQTQNQESQSNANDGGQQSENEKTFTQSELDRIVGDRAKQAKSAAQGELLKSLGVEKIDDLKGALDSLREIEEAKKSEIERLSEQATQAQSQAEQLQARLRQEQEDRLIERTANKLGFADVTDAIALVDRKSFGEEITGERVEETLKSLLESKPHLANQNAKLTKPNAPDIKSNSGNAASQTPDLAEAGKRYLPPILRNRS